MSFASLSDMYEQAGLYLDKYQAPNFIQEEFVQFYNNVVQQFVIERCRELEINQERIDDLRTLLKKETVSVLGVVGFTLPDDYQYLASVQWKIRYKDCANREVTTVQPSKSAKLDTLFKNAKSPFYKPTYKYILHELRQNEIIPYCDVVDGVPTFNTTNVTVDEGYINYIRVPVPISWNGTQFVGSFEFQDSVMVKIFELIIQAMLENIEQERLKTFSAINQKSQ